MAKVNKKFYYSDRLDRRTVSDAGPFGKIEKITYTKNDKEILITKQRVGTFQYKLLQNIGAIMASCTNTVVGLCESLLINCTEEIINDSNEIEMHFKEGMRIPYRKLVITPKEVAVLAKIIEGIIARTEEKYPELRFEGQNKKKEEEIEIVIWEKTLAEQKE